MLSLLSETSRRGGFEDWRPSLRNEGRPDGPPQDVLTGFRNAKGEAMGRPVGVAVDGRGALLVADDVGDAVWRVTPAAR